MADHRYRISGWRRLPIAHRAARTLIAVVILGLTLAFGFSPVAATSVQATRDLTARVTAFLWAPLLHSSPDPAPSPSPSPSPPPKKVKPKG